MTIRQIAVRFGTQSCGHLRRVMRELNIPIRRGGFKPRLPNDPALFRELYWKREMTMAEIATELGMSPPSVHHKMHELGMPTRQASMIPGRKITRRLEGMIRRDLPPDIRNEVTQELALGLLTGKIKLREAEGAIEKLTRKAFRDCRGDLRDLSLDAPLRSDGGHTTWAEMLEG